MRQRCLRVCSSWWTATNWTDPDLVLYKEKKETKETLINFPFWYLLWPCQHYGIGIQSLGFTARGTEFKCLMCPYTWQWSTVFPTPHDAWYRAFFIQLSFLESCYLTKQFFYFFLPSSTAPHSVNIICTMPFDFFSHHCSVSRSLWAIVLNMTLKAVNILFTTKYCLYLVYGRPLVILASHKVNYHSSHYKHCYFPTCRESLNPIILSFSCAQFYLLQSNLL